MTIRVGQGYDFHVFSVDSDKPLMLGGLHFPQEPGLVGHSDADAVIHACIDALLGAAGMGDIGELFPDTDPTWAGADSAALAKEVMSRLTKAGWSVVNVDCTIIAERPKIGPRRAEMQERLSELLQAPVTVKATGMEKTGFIGRGEGLACLAVGLIERVELEVSNGPTQ